MPQEKTGCITVVGKATAYKDGANREGPTSQAWSGRVSLKEGFWPGFGGSWGRNLQGVLRVRKS